MKRIRVYAFGEPDVLRYESHEEPLTGGENEVVIDIKAVGVNPVDVYIRAGNYGNNRPLPYTPGMDASGVVSTIGANVGKIRVGDRVYVSGTVTGAYAEQAVVKATDVHHLPDNVTFEQGAGVFVPYGTAYRAIFQRAQAKPGETLLVHGASGGVGIAAVQLARAYGMKVIGTAGTAEGIELILREGAHAAFNHREDGYLERAKAETDGKGFDVIVEMLANVNLQADMDALAMYGRIVVVGNRGSIEINPRSLMGKDSSVMGMSLFNMPESLAREAFAAIEARLENGVLRPIVGKTLPLSDAAIAHRDIMESGALGKIILLP